MKKIIFHSNREYSLHSNDDHPEPTSKFIPEWYLKSDKYITDPRTNEHALNFDGTKMLSYKSCPALLDIYTTGYMIKTPCDLFFYEENNEIFVKVKREYKDFCGERSPMKGFPVPAGYHEKHFHWYAQWAPELPEGYSAIHLSPINRFDLPFITVGGIIDNDKVNIPGLIPFFVKKGFTGIVPKGTPYMQIIPFKREDWEMELNLHTPEEIFNRFTKSSETFRKPGGNVYRTKFWTRRKYL